LAPFSTIDLRNPCQRDGKAAQEKIRFAFKPLGDDDPLSPNEQTEVESGVYVHLRRAAGGIALAIRHMQQ